MDELTSPLSSPSLQQMLRAAGLLLVVSVLACCVAVSVSPTTAQETEYLASLTPTERSQLEAAKLDPAAGERRRGLIKDWASFIMTNLDIHKVSQ